MVSPNKSINNKARKIPMALHKKNMVVHQMAKNNQVLRNQEIGEEKKKKKEALVITWHSIWLESDQHRDLGIVSWNVKNVGKMMIESESVEPWYQRECGKKYHFFFFFFFSFKNHIKNSL